MSLSASRYPAISSSSWPRGAVLPETIPIRRLSSVYMPSMALESATELMRARSSRADAMLSPIASLSPMEAFILSIPPTLLSVSASTDARLRKE